MSRMVISVETIASAMRTVPVMPWKYQNRLADW
jgi:hypothetical protein